MTLQMRPLTEQERGKTDRLTHTQTAPVRMARRSRIIALAATGLSVPTIAQHIQQSEACVRRWIERFNAAGWTVWTPPPPARDVRGPIPKTPTVV